MEVPAIMDGSRSGVLSMAAAVGLLANNDHMGGIVTPSPAGVNTHLRVFLK
jgi:hypothetical protein